MCVGGGLSLSGKFEKLSPGYAVLRTPTLRNVSVQTLNILNVDFFQLL